MKRDGKHLSVRVGKRLKTEEDQFENNPQEAFAHAANDEPDLTVRCAV